jgi:hypothetical protein
VRRYDQTRNVSDEAVETLLRAAPTAAATDLKPGVAIVSCNDGLGYWTMYGMV